MRNMIFGATLLAVAFVMFHSLISAALAAAQDAKPATFSERFAPSAQIECGLIVRKKNPAG